MKFHQLVLELHLLQNFCQAHTVGQTDEQTDIFQKESNRDQDISERVDPSKTGSRKFGRN